MLFVPNILWARHMPKDYKQQAKNENRILVMLERIGEVTVTVLVLLFNDCSVRFCWRALLLLVALVCMIMYEIYWVNYFKGTKTMYDFYKSICGIPLPGAVLPVVSVLLIAAYSKNVFLFIAGVVLGIGHIGIHFQHWKEVGKE